jgi:uncharacterized protein (TIGR03435 family)
MSNCIGIILKIVIFIFALPTFPIQAQAENQAMPSTAEKPRFEVISIRPGDKNGHLSDASFRPGGRFRVINLPLHGVIARYYGMPYAQVIGGPKFIDEDPWDIEAMPEEGKYLLKNELLDPDSAKLMVQSMLEERFKLKVHQETRILPGYELVIAKGGPNLIPPKDYTLPPLPGSGSFSRTKDPTKHSPGAFTSGSLWMPNISLECFAVNLSTMFYFYEEKKRIYVVDKTGLEGTFDIRLTWIPRNGGPSIASQNHAVGDSEITIFDAIQEQLGLKLVPAKATVPVLVVDDAQRPKIN